MKILLLKQNIKDEPLLQAGLAKVKELLSTINFPIEFDQFVTSTVFTSVPFKGATSDVKSGYQINPQQILNEEKKYGDYEVDWLIFDPSKILPLPPTNPSENGEIIQLPTNWYGETNPQNTFEEKINTFVMYFLHELCHERFWALGIPDITHNFYTSAFSSKPNGLISFYLFLLKGMLPVVMTIPKVVIPETTKELFKPKNFPLKELVSPDVYAEYGEKAWEFFDERILRNIQWLREKLGPIRVNNPLRNLRYRGFDACEFRKEGSSQHNMGRALDYDVIGMTPKQVTDYLIAHNSEMPEPNIWVELDQPHNHMDVRFSNKKGIYLFNP